MPMPLHTYCDAGRFILGVGFTVILKLIGVPLQPLKLGVAIIFATTGAVPLFRAVNAAILPLPFNARPMLLALLLQL